MHQSFRKGLHNEKRLQYVFPKQLDQQGDTPSGVPKIHGTAHTSSEILSYATTPFTNTNVFEAGHWPNVKDLEYRTNRKDQFMCILKHHDRSTSLLRLNQAVSRRNKHLARHSKGDNGSSSGSDDDRDDELPFNDKGSRPCELAVQAALVSADNTLILPDHIKSVAGCTNNKDVFMCIVRFDAREAYLQHYQTLLQELEGSEEPSSEAPSEQESGASTDSYKQDCTLFRDRNFNVACETGLAPENMQGQLGFPDKKDQFDWSVQAQRHPENARGVQQEWLPLLDTNIQMP